MTDPAVAERANDVTVPRWGTDPIWGRLRLYTVAMILFSLASLADAVSTVYAVHHGHSELNPLFSKLVAVCGPYIVFIPIIGAAAFLWWLIVIFREDGLFAQARFVAICMLLGFCIHGYASISNVEVVRHPTVVISVGAPPHTAPQASPETA